MLPLFIGLFTILLVIILLSKLHSLEGQKLGWYGLVFLVIIAVSVISISSANWLKNKLFGPATEDIVIAKKELDAAVENLKAIGKLVNSGYTNSVYTQDFEIAKQHYTTAKSKYYSMLKAKEGFVGAPIDYTLGKCGGLKYGNVADIATVTGNYDGLKLKGGVKPDYNILAADKVAYHSPVGDAYALNPDPYMTPTYAPIDGNAGSPRMMSMFAFNRSSPECCPSTFSSDRGCVCMSQAQRDFINSRGNQKHENGNPDF